MRQHQLPKKSIKNIYKVIKLNVLRMEERRELFYKKYYVNRKGIFLGFKKLFEKNVLFYFKTKLNKKDD